MSNLSYDELLSLHKKRQTTYRTASKKYYNKNYKIDDSLSQEEKDAIEKKIKERREKYKAKYQANKDKYKEYNKQYRAKKKAEKENANNDN